MTEQPRNAHTSRPWLIFGVPFLFSLGAYGLTLLNYVGPGIAAGWSNVLTATGEPASAAISPLYRTFLLLLGSIPDIGLEPHLIAGWLNALLMAMASGFFALFLYQGIASLIRWGAISIAMLGGALAGVAQLPWTVALTLNPAPLALALAMAALWLASDSHQSRHKIVSALLFGLAVSAHVAVAVLLPLQLWSLHVQRMGKTWAALATAFALPLALFTLPHLGPVFNLSGLFSQPPNIPAGLTGFGLLTWSKLYALTPFALLFVVLSIVVIIRERKKWILPGSITLIALTVASLVDFATEFAAILASMLIAGLAILGLAVVFNRLPRGLILVLWLLVPLFWMFHGPAVNRHGEDVWQIHARNVLTTQRYETMVATTDHERLLAPFLYMQREMDLRPDLLVVDPTLLTDVRYLESLRLDTLLQSASARAEYARLREILAANQSPGQRNHASLSFFTVWIKDALQSMTSGVMFSSELDPGSQVPLIPEGLLWRVNDGTSYPFLFSGLDLGPIYRQQDNRPLVQQTIRDYSMMFIQRADYLRQESFTIKVADYIRWAVRIDPAYPPAAEMAREFSIHGDPILLFPKVEPRIGPALPGVQQTTGD